MSGLKTIFPLALICVISSAFGAPPRAGVVSLEGRSFSDAAGPFPALGASLFWAVWGYKHDRTRLEENLRVLSEHDFDFIRVFAQVGPAHWEDRTIDPNWANYDEMLGGTIDLAYDRHGLRTELTIFGGTDFTPDPGSRLAFVDRVIRVVEPRAHKVIFIEVANEYFHDFIFGVGQEPELKRLGALVMEELPNLVTLTTPPPGEDGCALYRDSGVPLGSIHLPRDTREAEGMWGPVFAPWSYPYACMPEAGVNNEPIGPGASVASEDDPTRLVAAALVTWLSGMPGYVYHSHGGIWGGGAHSRGQSNLWEHPTAGKVFSGYKRLKEVLPRDLANWQRVPLENVQGVKLMPGGENAATRAFITTSKGRCCGLLVGERWEVKADDGAEVRVYALPELEEAQGDAKITLRAAEGVGAWVCLWRKDENHE